MTKTDDRPPSGATLSSGLATEVAPSFGSSPSVPLSTDGVESVPPSAVAGDGTAVFSVSRIGAGPLVSAVSLSSRAPLSEGTPFVEETNPLFASRYQVQSLLGSGGMGSVYLARDIELDELVALKILRKETLATPGALEMFRREVKLARKVTHPNVARTFDIGEADGQKYLTMEYVEGASLARVLEREPQLAVSRVLSFANAICAGLGAAHAVGVVHRDLKPENILIGKNDRVVITDFGIARPLEAAGPTVTSGLAIGTPAYMAPEQVEARRDIDGRVDIYTFGILLFEVLSGALPFNGDTSLAMAAARLIQPPPDVRTKKPDVPTPLAEVVLKCMARDREARFATFEDVSKALARVTMPMSPSFGVAPSSIPSPGGVKTVAVLPFRNAGATEDAFLADGLWDDLIDSLSMTAGLRVRPRGSMTNVLASAAPASDPVLLGREHGVDVIVDGSVRRIGENLRVSARLLNVADGFQLWARRFDKPSKEIFALSDEIATAVAEALTMQRNVPERDAPTDQVAVELYLRARIEARKIFTGGIEHALSLYEEALRRAPDDPTILAGYAAAQVRRWFFGNADAFAKAQDAAEKAVVKAPHLYEARNALALLKLHSADYAGAIIEFKSILSNQSFLASHESYASILHEIGLVEEAKEHIEKAMKIDPSSAFAAFELARIHAFAEDWDGAFAIMDRIVVTESFTVRAEISAAGLRFMLWKRDIAGARDRLKSRATENVGPLTKHLISPIVNGEVEREKISAAFRAAASVGSFRRRTLLHQLEAETAGILHDLDWFLEALQIADASKLIDIVWLDKCPLFTEFQSDSRVRAIAERIRYRANSLVEVVRTGNQ